MHTLVLVLLPGDAADPEAVVRSQMEVHRRPEGGEGRWDYFQIGGLYDGQVLGRDAAEPGVTTLEHNTCAVSSLKTVGGAILTPDGIWHDAGDWGFRMTSGEAAQRAALRRWEAYATELLGQYRDHIAISVDAHS